MKSTLGLFLCYYYNLYLLITMNKKKQTNTSKKQLTKIIGFGKADFNFTLELTESDFLYLNTSSESFTTLKGLKIIEEIPNIYERITVTSNSQLITTLLYMNKISKNKMFVEFATLSSIPFSDEEMFLKDIVTKAAEYNFLFISEKDFLPFYKSSITFNVKKGIELISSFNLCQNENSNVNRSQVEDATMYERLMSDFSQFNFLFIDLNEFIDLQHFNIGYGDILNLLSSIDRNYRDLNFCIFFPQVISNMNLLNLDAISQLSEILSYSDVIIFDKKEAIPYFNIITSNLDSSPNPKSKAQFKNVEKNFVKLDFRRRPNKKSFRNGNRVGFFLDELSTLNIIEIQRSNSEKVNNIELKINIVPKQNQANKRLIEEYKKQIDLHKPFLTSVFFGGFFSKFVSNTGIELPFLMACEITKRCLDLFKLGLEFPLENDFYIVTVKKSSLLGFKEKQLQKEKGFVLDCTNLNNSKLNDYNPLFDNNLSTFFSSNVVRRHLNEQGFINTRGFLLLDTKHKKPCLLVDKSADRYINRDKNLMLAVKENTVKSDYENVERILKNKSKMLNDPSITQLERLAMTLKYSPEKNKQLPSVYDSSIYFKPIGKHKLQPIKKEYLSKTSDFVVAKQVNKTKSEGMYIIII